VGRVPGRKPDRPCLDLIFAITLEDNTASQAVMKRIGLSYKKRVEYKGIKDVVWFDVDRATYEESTRIAAR
jgi:RimJ/RimL family protein N-acetyltransferase